MTPHDERHEDLLRAYFAQDADELPAECDACEQCREQVRALEQVSGLLDQVAEGERGLLAEAEGTRFPAGEERARAFFRARQSESAHWARPRRRLALVATIAASVLIASVLWLEFGAQPDREGPGVVLSSDRIVAIEPGVVATEWGRFAWDGELPRSGHWSLRVFAVADGVRRTLVDIERLTEPRWTVPATETIDWPATIEWEVRAMTAGGVQFSEVFTSSLRP